jgi:type I restriction enzyme R subunit
VSNFTFLNQDWPDLYETAREAEQNVNSAPRTSCFYARRSLERAVKWLYANDSYLKQPYAGGKHLRFVPHHLEIVLCVGTIFCTT